MTPETLKAWRETNALRQVDAATLAAVDRVTWNNWERRRTPIPTLMAWMMAAYDAGLPAPITPPDPETLKAWRETNGLRQTGAATLAGVTSVTWGHWERRITRIPFLMAWMIAAYDAGIDLDGTDGPGRPG